jgi:hypothetical protein
MNATAMDLHALLWGEDPDRRAIAADNLERQAQGAAGVLSALLSFYISRTGEAAMDAGPLRDIFDPAMVRRTASAIHDLAGLAAEFGTARVKMNAARARAAQAAGD